MSAIFLDAGLRKRKQDQIWKWQDIFFYVNLFVVSIDASFQFSWYRRSRKIQTALHNIDIRCNLCAEPSRVCQHVDTVSYFYFFNILKFYCAALLSAGSFLFMFERACDRKKTAAFELNWSVNVRILSIGHGQNSSRRKTVRTGQKQFSFQKKINVTMSLHIHEKSFAQTTWGPMVKSMFFSTSNLYTSIIIILTQLYGKLMQMD